MFQRLSETMGAMQDRAIDSVLVSSDKEVRKVSEEDAASRDRSALCNRGNAQ